MAEIKCICGDVVSKMTSYFSRETGARKTVCDKCATIYGFTDIEKYYAIPFNNLKEEHKKRNAN